MKWMLFLLPLALVATPVLADESAASGHGDTLAEDHHEKDHHAALFVGGTTNFDHSSTDFTLGGEYEFRLPLLHRLLGIGIFGEAVFAEHKEVLCGVPVFVHPVAGLKFFAAPGALIVESEAHFLVRVGTGYDFHIGAFSITPTVYTDIVEGHASLAYGVSFGVMF